MLKNKSGDLLGVFHRDDVGDIDLVWGDRNRNAGLDHIIEKHIERLKDFSSAEEAIQVIEDVINNGQIDEKKSKWDKVFIEKDGYAVVISKNVRNEKGEIVNENKNWVVTAFDATINPKRKEVNSSDVTRVTLNTNKGGRAVTSDERTSDSKDSELSQKSKEDAEENKKPRLEKADSKTTEVSSTDALLRDALVRILRKMGIKVITDNKKAQRVLEEENESVRMQAKLDSLVKAVRTIHGWLSNNKRDKVFTIELPKATQEMIHKVMGRDFNSHNITANGIAHGLKNHGENGLKLNKQSIPIRKEDAELIPYIMTAPDYVKKGSTDISGRESIRFYKELSNGYVVVVEKEYKNSLNDMETINIWAEMSSEATNALHKAVPDIHVQNAILSTDVAKIRKDAEDAIRRDNKLREQRVWHDSDKVRFFRTANGEAYGFTVDGKIYLDPTIAGAETAIHEYTHLWATALKNANPKEWSNIVSLMKGTPLWDKVASEYPELTTDDELADEVLAHYSGKRGAERLRKEAESIANGKGSLLDKAGAISALERVKEALTRFWKATADLLHIHFTTAEEVADKVLADLLNGVNPNAMQDRKELIAVHNITEDKLKKALSLGGFPMPSIAITKAEIGHETFGDISLIFDKESIDPTDKRNKVYGEDAWTPVFPNVGYKLNDDKTSTIYSKANKAGHLPMFNPVDFHQSNYENKIDERGDESLVERFKEDYGAKQLYLSETGNAVKEFLQHEVEKYRPKSVALYEKLLKDIGIERLKNENYESLKDEIKQLINQHYGIDIDSKKPIIVKARIQNTIHHAIDYAENGNLKTESDIDATKAKIDGRIDEEKFVKWLEKLFAGVVEKKGIRNDRDWFTSSGNRRKWEQLYDEITLDNVVDAMQKQASKGGEGLFGGSIFGSAQKEYSSIDEIRNSAKERIQAINEDDYNAQRDAITNRLSSIEIPGAGRGFSDTMDMIQNIQDAVTKSHTAKGIHKYLKRFYPKITLEIAKEIEGIVKDIQRMSARYFEAKPYRAVGFEEVRLAIMPSDTDASLVEQLKQKGIEIRTYERGNQMQRRQIADEATRELNLRFQLIGEQGAEESTSGEDLEEVNARFNEELQQQIDGTLPQGHIYNMGRPGKILLSTGIPNLPIQMNATKLKDKSTKFGHDYELSEVKDLVRALQHPLAVFAYGNKTKAQNIIIPLKRGDKNFIVGLSLNPIIDGHKLEINSIRNVFPKNNAEWLNWITQGKTLYLDKEKIQTLINQQRTILADVEYLDLDSITKITQTSDNPSIDEENLFRKPVGGNSGYVGYSMSKRAEQAREDGRFPKTDFKREYKVSESSLQALSRIGIISDNEWHHTSSYGNKTTFYGWADEAFAEYYLEHKKEIDKATDNLLRLKEEDIDKYFSALDDFRKEMRKSFDVGTSGLSKSKYDFEQELRSRTSDAVVRILRKMGIKVITDNKEAQRVLEEENGRVKAMSFGERYDYKQYPNGRIEPNLSNKEVRIKKADLNHEFSNFDEAKEWAKKNIVRTLNNNESGGKGNVRISGTAVGKYLSESAVEKSDSKDVHLAVLKVLPDVIKESIDVETTPDFEKDENGVRKPGNKINKDVLIHRCYGAVVIDGKIYRVKITLKEYKDANETNKAYSYEATKIELLAGTLANDSNTTTDPGTNNSISVAKLLKDVDMTYNPGVKVLEESRKRTDRLREQRVSQVEESERQYKKAQEVLDALYEAGVTGLHISRSITDFGVSTYIQGEYGLKFRISDHSATNTRRVLDEIGFDYSTPIDELVKIAQEKKDFYEKLEKRKEEEWAKYKAREKAAEEKWERIKDRFHGYVFKSTDRTYQNFEIFSTKGEYPRLNILQKELGGGSYSYEWAEPTEYDKFGRPTNSYGKEKPSMAFIEAYDENTGEVSTTRFFRTANGEAYGFTVDGKIYLDPTIAGAETAIHEYTHLWATALKNANPKEWSNIVSLMKGTPLWDKVASEYPELTTDDELADEVLAHYSGKRGAERLRKEAESIANGKGSLLDKAGAISALERVKEALTRFWKATADLLHIHSTTAEEVADKVLADLLNGVNPNEVAKNKNLRFQLIGEQGAEESTSGDDLEEMNARFNEELQQQIDGTLPQGHIYQLGMASAVLQSAGLPNLPIELSASRLKDKSKQEEHPFELSEMRGLVDSVQNPLAVFRSATHIGSFVVLTEIEHQGKNFVVAIQANRRQGRIEINSIRSVHYRNKNTHIANWITEGLLEYADKKRMAEWLSKQRYNSADVRKLFNHATKIVNEFDNPIINEENLYRKPVGGNSGYVGYSMSKRAEQAREDGRFPKTDFKREYKVSESSLQALSRIGIISDNEWHHTSSYGNKTTFYGWADEAFAEYYLEHKKEIDKATDNLLRLKEEDIDKYFSALDDFRKEMRKSFDVGTSGLSKSKYDFEQELRSRTSDEVVAEYQRQKSEYTSTESNPKPFPSILKWQSQNKDLVKEIENKVRQEMLSSPTAIADSVMSLAERLHLDNVEIVTDASALSGKEAKAKGFYTKSTGKITIVVPNNTSAEDAVQTLLHEAVAHYGLRKLFGSEFDNFLDAVLENADKEVLERIYDLAQANGWDYRKATEEYLATLAETTEFENTDKGWWNKVKKLFVDMLRKLGIKALDGTTLTDNELRYILWASYQNLKGTNDSLIGLANDIVKREDLGIEESEDDKLFRTEAEQPVSYEQAMVRDLYDQRMASGVYQSIEALQDSMRSVKEFMGMVDKAENGKARYIEDIDDFENAYLGENRLSSQNKAETDLAANLLLKPLLKAMAIWIFYNFNCHKIHSEYIKGQ